MAGDTEKRSKRLGVIPGVGLSRTLPPVLPPNFLSRKTILADLAVDKPGVTLITAPAGFGKSTLVAEYVDSLDLPVIWYTATDSDGTTILNSHLLQAIRNVLPNFAPWYAQTLQISSYDFLAKILGEIGEQNQHFIIVFDNNRTTNPADQDTVNRFLDLIPDNIHVIAIRRSTPVGEYSRLIALTNFAVIGINELKFSPEEVLKIATLHGISSNDQNVKLLLESARGWPAALQIIATQIKRGIKMDSLGNLDTFTDEQLNLLVAELLKSVDPEDREFLEILSVFEEFSEEDAAVALVEKFSLPKLDFFASEALFLIFTADSIYKYAINPLIRSALKLQAQDRKIELSQVHLRLMDHFGKLQQHLKSVSHAKESGEIGKFRVIFRENMRTLIATGRGKELISLASIVGDSSPKGLLKRQTVELIGYVADFQYQTAQSLIGEMAFLAKGTALEEFIDKFTSAAHIYIDFALARTEDLEENVRKVRSETGTDIDLGKADKISILRVMAAKEIIYDDWEKLEKLKIDAEHIADGDSTNLVHYFLSAISAASLLGQGEYNQALAMANNVILQAERHGYSGIFGPLDAMYVRARCLLEASKVAESQVAFEEIRNLANKWEQQIWVFLAESFLAHDLVLNGNTAAALALVRSGRDRALALEIPNGLSTYCDLTELFIKFTIADWDRVGILLNRLPNFLLVERIRVIYADETGKSSPAFVVSDLPDGNPRDKIYKLLAVAEENIDKEAVALDAMRQALEIGALVGAKETFLRQGSEILNLIIKISITKPTVYLEELSSLITFRLKQRTEVAIGAKATLTKREFEILRHLSTGVPISSIANTLHVSQNTMKTHLKNVYRKLEVSGRDDAVVRAKTLYIL